MDGRKRWMLWLALLAVAAWLALFGDRTPAGQALSLPTRPAPATAPLANPTVASVAPAKGAEPDVLIAREILFPEAAPTAAARDPFAPRSWAPPAPPPAAVTSAPVAPTAPPLPYVFLGKKHEDGRWEVFLARGEQSFVVREGQTLEGQYRVDKIAPPSLTLTYLPLDQPQQLTIGDAH